MINKTNFRNYLCVAPQTDVFFIHPPKFLSLIISILHHFSSHFFTLTNRFTNSLASDLLFSEGIFFRSVGLIDGFEDVVGHMLGIGRDTLSTFNRLF